LQVTKLRVEVQEWGTGTGKPKMLRKGVQKVDGGKVKPMEAGPAGYREQDEEDRGLGFRV
jgi:hypothetical protein